MSSQFRHKQPTRFNEPEIPQDLATKGYVDNNTGSGLSVVKLVDQSVTSSIVLVDDDELFFAAEANKVYMIKLFIFVSGAAAADLRMSFSLPAGAVGAQMDLAESFITAGQLSRDITSDCLPGTNVATNPQIIATMARVIMAGTAGTIQWRWAQRVSNATATIIQQGTMMEVSESV